MHIIPSLLHHVYIIIRKLAILYSNLFYGVQYYVNTSITLALDAHCLLAVYESLKSQALSIDPHFNTEPTLD